MKKATLTSISEHLGISATTISRVLNGKAEKYRISKKTIDRVLRAAEQYDYRPNLVAQSLRTQKTRTIGLVVPSIDNPFFAGIANVIIHEARNNHYTVVLVDTMENEENEREDLPYLLSRSIDGIIIVPCGKDPKPLERINQTQIPVILVDRYFERTSLSYVSADNYLGGFNATELLIRNGHRRILCIQGPKESMTVRERVRGYRDALKKYGLENEELISGEDFSIQNGYVEMKMALMSQNRPTAVFAFSNTILLGSIKAIKENGYRIPDDISIVSFDDNTYLDFMNPAITCINQPIEEIGIMAFKLLLQAIDASQGNTTQILLPPKTILRDSVAPPATNVAKKEEIKIFCPE